MRSDFLLELRAPLAHYALCNGVCPTPWNRPLARWGRGGFE